MTISKIDRPKCIMNGCRKRVAWSGDKYMGTKLELTHPCRVCADHYYEAIINHNRHMQEFNDKIGQWHDQYKTVGYVGFYWGFWLFPTKELYDKFIEEERPITSWRCKPSDGDFWIEVVREPGDVMKTVSAPVVTKQSSQRS